MNRIESARRGGLLGLVGVLLVVGIARGLTQGGGNDAQIQADVMKSLDSKRFKDVKASVQNGVVILTGTVEPLQREAGRRQPGASPQEREGRRKPD